MNRADIEIRKARSEEQGMLAELIQAMALESEGWQLDACTLAAGIRAVFERPERGTYWVLAEGTRLIGCTLITTEWSDWHNAAYWWMQSLYIRPESRGQGLLQALLKALEQEAQLSGVREIRLYVEKENARAIRAYEKSGFAESGYLMMSKPSSALTSP